MNDKPQQAIKRYKFTDQQIQKPFKILKSDDVISNASYIPRINYNNIHVELCPINIDKSFAHPDKVKRHILPGKKPNAIVLVCAGNKYDSYAEPRQKTDEERQQIAIKKANVIVDRMNEIFAASDDPLYSLLEAEIVNKDFNVFTIYNDHSDDGDDYYGVSIYIKISYKK